MNLPLKRGHKDFIYLVTVFEQFSIQEFHSSKLLMSNWYTMTNCRAKSVSYGKGCVLMKCFGHKFYAGRYCFTVEYWIMWLLNFIFFFRKSKCPKHWRSSWRYVLHWHLGKRGLLRNGKWLFQPCDFLQQLLCIPLLVESFIATMQMSKSSSQWIFNHILI